MSQENVDVVKRVFLDGTDLVALLRAPDLPDASSGIDLTVFEDDFETQFVATRVFGRVQPRVWHGLEGFAEGWRDWLEPYDTYYIEVEEFIDAGEQVVSLARAIGQTTRDAVAVEHKPAAVWSLRGGKIVRVRFFLEREEAFEAAGLRE